MIFSEFKMTNKNEAKKKSNKISEKKAMRSTHRLIVYTIVMPMNTENRKENPFSYIHRASV